jgi:hypothetical protein
MIRVASGRRPPLFLKKAASRPLPSLRAAVPELNLSLDDSFLPVEFGPELSHF